MPSILQALTREFLQRGRVRLLIAALVPGGIQSLNYLLLLLIGISWADRRDLMMHELVVVWSFVAAAFAVVPSLSDAMTSLPTRLYTAPIATWVLVGWRMLLGSVAGAAIYLFSALFCNVLMDVAFPVIGPALFVAAGLALLLAMFWSATDFSLWKIPLCGIGSIALIVRWSDRYGNHSTRTQVALVDYAVIFAAVLVAYLVATTTVARDRRGCSRSWPDLQHLYNRLTDRLSGARLSFATAESAQFWYEWKPRGGVIPCLLAGMMLCITAGIAIHESHSMPDRIDEETIISFIVTGGMFVPILGGLLAGLFIGDRTHKRTTFDLYIATRPLSDASLARIVLQAVTLSTVYSWIVCWACVALGLATFSLVGEIGSVSQWLGRGFDGNQWQAWGVVTLIAAGSLGISVTIANWTAVFIAAGRVWLFAALILVVFGIPLMAMSLAVLDPPKWIMERCGSGLMLGVGMLGVGLASWAVLSAWLNESVGTPFTTFAAVAWMCALIAISLGGLSPVTGDTAAFLLGLVALALTPPALAPRAIAWNRHR